MFFFKGLKKFFLLGKSFLHNQAGALIIILALALIPMIGFLGLAIDLGRDYYAHSFLTGAVDAAAIAGAKAGGSPANMTQQATAIFNANIPKNFSGTVTGPNIQISANGQTITVSATATLDTVFMQILGQNTISIDATSQASTSSSGTEVVLALDNTGSMAGAPMQGEISAAQLLVNTIYGGSGNDTVSGLYVGVVPYTTTVNINMPGLNPSSWLTAAGNIQIANRNLYPNIAPTSTSVGGLWMGCIEARTPPIYAAGLDSTDTPPTSNTTKFTPFLYPSTMAHKYAFGTALTRGTTTTSTTALAVSGSPPWGTAGSTRGDNDWRLNGTVPSGSGLFFGDNYNWHGGDGNKGVGPNLGCPIPMLPLTASQTTVLQTINNMKATFRGGTMINVGLASAWWMLSPNWTGLWPNTPSTLPQAYNSGVLKIVILMTDGQNQWYDWPGGVPGHPDSSHNYAADADYTGYGRLAEGRTGTTVFGNTTPLLNTSMANMCSTLKSNGVVIYAVIFDHDGSAGDANTQATFQSCASDPSKYFISFTNQDLINAFQNIGQSITSLRLSWPGKP